MNSCDVAKRKTSAFGHQPSKCIVEIFLRVFTILLVFPSWLLVVDCVDVKEREKCSLCQKQEEKNSRNERHKMRKIYLSSKKSYIYSTVKAEVNEACVEELEWEEVDSVCEKPPKLFHVGKPNNIDFFLHSPRQSWRLARENYLSSATDVDVVRFYSSIAVKLLVSNVFLVCWSELKYK